MQMAWGCQMWEGATSSCQSDSMNWPFLFGTRLSTQQLAVQPCRHRSAVMTGSAACSP